MFNKGLVERAMESEEDDFYSGIGETSDDGDDGEYGFIHNDSDDCQDLLLSHRNQVLINVTLPPTYHTFMYVYNWIVCVHFVIKN